MGRMRVVNGIRLRELHDGVAGRLSDVLEGGVIRQVRRDAKIGPPSSDEVRPPFTRDQEVALWRQEDPLVHIGTSLCRTNRLQSLGPKYPTPLDAALFADADDSTGLSVDGLVDLVQ